MKTAKAIPTKAAIFSYFQGHHLALEVYDKTSINESDVEKRLRAAGGAHQPSDMKFPGGGHPVKLGVDLLSSSSCVSSSTSTPKPTANASTAASAATAPTQMPKPTSFYVKSSAPVATTETINLATTPVAAVTSAVITTTTTTSGATLSAINAIIEKGKGLAASGEPVSAADVSALIAELEVIAKSLI
jgi:hypothetical protein